MGLISAAYGLGLSCKKWYYRTPKRLPAGVISIGNLTLGGTGKTPAVISVAQEAKNRGLSVCILTRGYRGRTMNITFVSRGSGPLLSPAEAGDEACLMAEALEGVPIVKGKDRYEAGLFALDNLKTKPLFILDDGFQHWKLFRDADVLLIDATNPFGNGKLFPEGRLREPLSAMNRAHIIVITKSDMAQEGSVASITRTVRQYNQDAPLFTSSHRAAGLVTARGESMPADSLQSKSIYAFCGIANPASFTSTLTYAGAAVRGLRAFRDHYIYTQKDIDEIISDAAGMEIITTEKDLVKLKNLDIPENLRALKVAFSVNGEFYDSLFTLVSL
ncbi:MAG: tetraacyldisaccharide 4'-kinase [Nitrospiraceae bacterium]|nr:MAG: tetraacyldisaccharide 4'-kinase [Nitrospiraceae bacterium]